MPGSEVWIRTRERLKRFPQFVAACSEEASAYGRCVATIVQENQDLRKNMCAKEFQAFKKCFTINAKKAW
ncbi:NADH dehydrogenase [ubiquinone] 1 alpha subcomplex assembly factor 8 [Leucoraja erinacea]|uniref:NADH dehydrogenase [ubiquinone] 1 alpha subcomplex assembly factor 8 n=1 Tax=Leucoraja erinaceus TaxID=7782 RepID=UPI002458708F|nr:NADH dehydrogenase [ubiquinone] 1 alpha subcomplex assembly factor 8 [Leucoraja erinacea]